MNDSIVIVDSLNLIHRMYAVLDKRQGLATSNGRPTGLEYGFFKTLHRFINRYKMTPIVVWEQLLRGEEANNETAMAYKAGRNKPNSEFFYRVDRLRQTIMDTNAFYWAQGLTQEADHVIDAIAKIYSNDPSDCDIYIFSNDRDLFQCLRFPDTFIMKPKNEERPIGVNEFIAEYGVTPENFAAYKTLVGDTSDNLSGVYRMPKKKAADIVNNCDGDIHCIKEELLSLSGRLGENARKYIESGKFDQTYDLVLLRGDAKFNRNQDSDNVGIPSNINDFLEELEIRSIKF